MIYTKSIKQVKISEHDQVWAIVRSLKTHNKDISQQVQELSPSYTLFKIYLDLKATGNWNKQTFESIYKPRFLEEMQKPEAQKMLNVLCDFDKQGENICLVCFCEDANLCHRSLVAELLKARGCNVKVA